MAASLPEDRPVTTPCTSNGLTRGNSTAPASRRPRTKGVVQRKAAGGIAEAISASLLEVQGTIVEMDTPLMAAGLDSISATEFARTLAEQFDTELPQTVLFDHPTIAAIASFVAVTTDIGE